MELYGKPFLEGIEVDEEAPINPERKQRHPNFAAAAPPTSLKLSNAERMISWPPRTRQTAARSSSTRAFVLGKNKKQKKKNSGPHLIPLFPAPGKSGSCSLIPCVLEPLGWISLQVHSADPGISPLLGSCSSPSPF